ncbi:phage capsid superfamily [Candidatus Termititenax aidoneus]|uniref:Phage capsid superfamily n=1 Tax=Termititenax aidoneus TaxID=2218524 RepID=A0A388TCG2_TERA1|nr:phage capsid superfamily [Candidatus Termititenax aidoneus]
MNKRILELLAQGKTDAEIASAVLKEFAASADDVAKAILAAKKEQEVAEKLAAAQKEAELKATEDKKAEELKSQIASGVEGALKKIGVDPTKKFESEQETFSPVHKKVIKQKVSEDRKMFAQLLKYAAQRDMKSVHSLGADINAKRAQIANAPLLSNVPTGNVLVPVEIEQEIFAKAYTSKILSLVNTNVVSYMGKLYPVLSDVTFAERADRNTNIGDGTPTIDAPKITPVEVSAIAGIDNALIAIVDRIIDAIVAQAGNSLAKVADRKIPANSVADGGAFDGFIFDTNTDATSAAKALSALVAKDLVLLKNKLSPEYRDSAIFLSSDTVRDVVGLLPSFDMSLVTEDATATGTGGLMFPTYTASGTLRPFGRDYPVDNFIPDTINLSTKSAAAGNPVLLALDPSTVYAAYADLRIDFSQEYFFAKDQMAIRFIAQLGSKVIVGNGKKSVAAQSLTNS